MIELCFDSKKCFKAASRGHQVVIDVPPEKAGDDRGLMPTEIFTTALSACVGITMVNWLEKHDLKADGLRISSQMGMSLSPRKIETIKLKIDYPNPLSAEQKHELQQTFSSCPVMLSLKNPPAVEISL